MRGRISIAIAAGVLLLLGAASDATAQTCTVPPTTPCPPNGLCTPELRVCTYTTDCQTTSSAVCPDGEERIGTVDCVVVFGQVFAQRAVCLKPGPFENVLYGCKTGYATGGAGVPCSVACPSNADGICGGSAAGLCSQGLQGTGFCQCHPGFTGASCQFNDSQCNGHGTANFDGSCSCAAGYDPSHNCSQCAPSFYGPSCTFCSNDMCGGHGTCDTSPTGNGACTCSSVVGSFAFGGAYCNACAATPPYYDYPVCRFCSSATTCFGHGSCNPVDGATCNCNTGYGAATNCSSCAPGFFGPNCLTCAGSPQCSGNGLCSNVNNGPACVCNASFFGPACAWSDATSCSNHGTVVLTNGGNNFVCSCQPGYARFDCSLCAADYYPSGGGACTFCLAGGGPGSNCANGFCSSNGTCNCNPGFAFGNASDAVHCATCLPGYYGPSCIACSDFTTCNALHGGGVCNPTGTPQCQCNPGFRGADCELCAPGRAGPDCVCNPGFTGADCSTPIDHCSPDPCQNGGACLNSLTSYTCSCPANFSGAQCQTPVSAMPRAECVAPDPANPSLSIVVFGYERGVDAGTVPVAPGGFNQILVNGVAVGDAGQPTSFGPGLHPNQFAFRFNPATQTVAWSLLGVSAGPTASTPVCANPQGAQGPTGQQGPAGPDGVRGAAGPTGLTGPTGSTGPTGPTGAAGSQGFAGLIGAQGAQGTDGARGAVGSQGPSGSQGIAGVQGATGAQGAAGIAGAGGATGGQGDSGAPGVAGARGATGAAGNQGIIGGPGVPGPQGSVGASGLDLSFVSVDVSAAGALTLSSGNASVVYLVSLPISVAPTNRTELALPPAASAATRRVTVRQMDARGIVVVRAAGGEPINGALGSGGSRDAGAVVLDRQGAFVTLASDGSNWFVIAGGR